MHHRALADLEAAEERHKAQAAADPQAANEAPGWTAVIDAYSRFDGVAIWIRNHRDEALKQGPELEQKFARHAQVWQELANLYRAPKERERAIRAYIKLSPDFWAYQRLTQMLKAQKRMDEWKATIDDFLAQPEAGLTHAQMRVEVANYYMDRSEWKEAEPYAAAAAETWAEWAILCAIRCYQGLGDVEQESLWRSRVVGRYPNPRNWREWYVHCQNRRRPPATTSQAAIHQPPMTSGASVFDPLANAAANRARRCERWSDNR